MLSALLTLLFSLAYAPSSYFIGKQGESCYETCHSNNMNCNPHVVTNNSASIFNSLGIQCVADPRPWWAEDQPSYVSASTDPNYGRCIGFTDVPGGVVCGGKWPTTRRLCFCDAPTTSLASFGTGLSNGVNTNDEQIIFDWIIPETISHGVMTHFWASSYDGVIERTLVRYYVDDEPVASIQFYPPIACGSAVTQTNAPWGNKWFGKGSKYGSWYWNFGVPFRRSIRITTQITGAASNAFYIIVRGEPQIPIEIGGIRIPNTAKLILQKVEKTVQPLEWVPVADFPTGSGLFFMHTLWANSNNLNFLEGCYHQYSPYGQSFPGTLLSTGTEDYFDSGWYFNAGEFQLPVSGLTMLTDHSVSAYRFHEMDPLAFDAGFRLVWRNGDAYDASGRKCFIEEGGSVVGSPGPSNVTSYGWTYVWGADMTTIKLVI